MKKNLLIIFALIVLIWIYISRSRFTSSSSDIYSFYEKFKNRFTLMNQSSSGKSPVDMIYTVTMPQRKDYITEQMGILDMEYKLFDAIKQGDLTDSEISKISKVNTSGSRIYKLPTRLFHTFSFTMCFIDAIKNGYSNIIVFEDDIIINVDISTLENSIMEFNNSDNDFFYLGYCFLNCRQPQDKEKYS
jgi:hypothetical protein